MKCGNCIKSQLFRMLHSRNFWLSFWCVFLYSCITYLYQVFVRLGVNTSDMLQGSSLFVGWGIAPFSKYFVIMFPFIVTITFSFSYFEENTDGVSLYSILRTGTRSYYFAKLCVGFIGNFCVMAIPHFLNIFLNFITFPENGNTIYGNKMDSLYYRNLMPGTHMPFLEVYMEHEILYLCLYTIFLGCFAGVLGSFSCAVAAFIKKNKVFVFIPLYLLFYFSQRYSNYFFDFNLENYLLLDSGGYSDVYCSHMFIFLLFMSLCAVFMTELLTRVKKWEFMENTR